MEWDASQLYKSFGLCTLKASTVGGQQKSENTYFYQVSPQSYDLHVLWKATKAGICSFPIPNASDNKSQQPGCTSLPEGKLPLAYKTCGLE